MKLMLLLTVLCLLPCIQASLAAEKESARPPGAFFPGKIRLMLPKVLYAVEGLESNVYFDNVVLAINPGNYIFDVTCAKGVQQSERWTFVPQADDAGEYPFEIRVRDEDNRPVAQAKSVLRVVGAQAAAGRPLSLLCIGDSLTHASVYTGHLLDLCSKPGNPSLTLIGTHHVEGQPEANRHEGYGGWTAERFVSHYNGYPRTGTHTEIGSPFLYPDSAGKPHLDFARYCRETNGGKAPDMVTLFLGCNDTFHGTDETLTGMIDCMLRFCDQLIGMIHGFDNQTRVGVMLIVPPAATQDAFGANYGCSQTRWQYKRNQHEVVRRLMEKYGNREGERIELIPAYVNLDCAHNYPKTESPWNARAAQVGARLNNGVHPSAEGYRQIGDSIYAWLKAGAGK